MEIGTSDYNHTYTLTQDTKTTTITKVNSEKDLGITFDNKLKFSIHINNSVKKANMMLGLIFRTFTFLDKSVFVTLYKSLVRPHLEYGSTIWSPIFKKDRIQIENVQRRATKMVGDLKNESYSYRLRKLGLPSLEYRRERSDQIQLFKIMNNYDIIDKDKLFQLAPYQNTRGNSKKLFKRQRRLNMSKNMFSNRVVNTWNSLPSAVVESNSVNIFKSRLNIHWKNYPSKFTPSCYNNYVDEHTQPVQNVQIPDRIEGGNQNAPTQANN